MSGTDTPLLSRMNQPLDCPELTPNARNQEFSRVLLTRRAPLHAEPDLRSPRYQYHATEYQPPFTLLRACDAPSGTDSGYLLPAWGKGEGESGSGAKVSVVPLQVSAYALATRCPVLAWRMMVACSAKSGSGLANGGSVLRPGVCSRRDPTTSYCGISLRVCCAMPGTDLAYGATRLRAVATRFPVLTERMVLPQGTSRHVFGRWYDPLSAYAHAMRCPVLTCRSL
eukprot:1889990-Rhodomonas_salina.1